MKEFTYEKNYKDPKTGFWFKQAMFNHRLVTYSDRGTQCDSNFKIKEKNKKIPKITTPENKKCDKTIEFEEIDNSKRKLRADEVEMEMGFHKQEFGIRKEFSPISLNKENILNEESIDIAEKINILEN